MNVSGALETGQVILNSTISSTKQTASIISENTGIPDSLIVIGLILILMWSLRGRGTSLITWSIIALLIFVIVQGGLLW
jgi:hypothetical protein